MLNAMSRADENNVAFIGVVLLDLMRHQFTVTPCFQAKLLQTDATTD